MARETTAAEGIRTTEENAKCDAACKILLSEKIFLAWIMRSCLEEYKNFDVNEIAEKYIEGEPQISETPVAPNETNNPGRIHGISNEDTSLHEGRVVYDIRFLAVVPVSSELIRLIINVEAQGKFHVGYPFPKRGIYYCSRMISAQYGTEFTGSQYQDIKKVYSIWILMNPPQERENSITRYRMVEENLVGHVKEPVNSYDLMTMLMICLGEPEETESNILKLLDTLLTNEISAKEKQQILKNNFDIPITQSLERRLDDMCNLSMGFEERGIAKGMAKGMAEGVAKGRAEGRAETIINSIVNLMKNTGWPVEQAMATLGVPEKEWANYTKMLAEQ